MRPFKITLLLSRQWLENRKLYATSAAALTGLLSLMFLVTWHWRSSFSGGVQKGIFLLGLFAGGGIFVSLVLRSLGNKSKGMWLLCLPASAGEKLATAFFVGILSYLVLYTGIFYTVETCFLWLVNDRHTKMQHTDLFENGFCQLAFTWLNIQLLVLLGSICFNRLAFLKTLLLLIIGIPLLNMLNNYLLAVLTGIPEIDSSLLFDYFQFTHKGENVYVYLPDSGQRAVTIILHYLLPVALYFASLWKLKEKEL